MDTVLRFDTERAGERSSQLFGTWQVVGVTGRWPQVVNLWELVDGWEGWKRLVAASGVRRAENAPLAEWWEEAYRHRSGGFDRLLLAHGPVVWDRAPLFVHELSTVRPGAARAYLDAVRDEWAPVMAEHGHRLVGTFEVLFTESEVVVVWATDLDGHAGLHSSDDARVTAWRETARPHLSRWREELMVPGLGSPLAPT